MKQNTIQCNFENILTRFSGENDTNKLNIRMFSLSSKMRYSVESNLLCYGCIHTDE